jgi:hypothetical protein
MYGSRMFGSNHEALRLLKLLPEYGTDPFDATLKLNGGGPWLS